MRVLRDLLTESPGAQRPAIQATLAGSLDTLAECLWRTDQYEKAIETQREAVELTPDTPWLKEKLEKWEKERTEDR